MLTRVLALPAVLLLLGCSSAPAHPLVHERIRAVYGVDGVVEEACTAFGLPQWAIVRVGNNFVLAQYVGEESQELVLDDADAEAFSAWRVGRDGDCNQQYLDWQQSLITRP